MSVLRLRLPPLHPKELTVKIYGGDVQVRVKDPATRRPSHLGKQKGHVSTGIFSRAQQKSGYRALCMIEPEAKLWVTLSYPAEFPTDYNTVRKHVHQLLVELGRLGFKDYVGGYEFQKRGAVHVNIVFTDYIPHLIIKEKWHRIVGTDDPHHLHRGVHLVDVKERAGHKFKHYIAGYIGKERQKEAPEGFKNMRRWFFWSKKYTRPTETLSAPVTDEDLDSFLDGLIDYKNGVLEKLNKEKGRDYHLSEKGCRIGLSVREGASVARQLFVKGVKNSCRLRLIDYEP